MRVNKIEKLESLKNRLQDCLGEIEAVAMRADEDSIISMMNAVDEIELALKEAKNVVAEVRKI